MKTLYFGGEIFTPDEKIEAVLAENGSIIFTGRLSDAQKLAPDAARFDLAGRTMLPAFTDAHGHFSLCARYQAFADLSECKSHAELAATLADYAANAASEQPVILANGFDESRLHKSEYRAITFGEQAKPTRELLDAAVPDKPVCMLHVTGHSCVINTKMAELAGIPLKSEAGEEFDGYLEEIPALAPVLGLAMSKLDISFEELIDRAQTLYLKYGITLAQDGALSYDSFTELKRIAERGKFKLDLDVYINADEYPRAASDFPDYLERKNHLRIAGAKLILDGSPQIRTAWLSKPYENDPNNCGIGLLTDAYLQEKVKFAAENRVQLLLHCNGDAASEQCIRAFESLEPELRKKIRETRPIMIHAQTVRDDQLERMSELGIIPSFFAAHIPIWGELHLKQLGAARAAHLSPAGSALKLGLPFTLHQDAPVLKPNPMQAVKAAVERTTESGILLGEDQKISQLDAIKAITSNAAYCAHEEKLRGRIMPGLQARFVILGKNSIELA